MTGYLNNDGLPETERMKKTAKYPSEKGLYGIFNDSFPPILDGVTLTVENYVKHLKDRGLEPCVVTPWNPVSVECDHKVLKYFSLPIYSRHPYRYGYPRLDPFIWRRLRQTDFKIVHCHCPFSSGRLGVYVKKKQHVPLIGTFHSKYKSDLMHGFRHATWCVNVVMRRIIDFFNSCDEVWIPQASVEETVREYGYKGQLTVMENGSDMEAIAGGDTDAFKAESRRILNISDKTLSLLFVGQHIWEKGIDVILEALIMLKDKVDFQMNFIGTGYAEADMRRIIRDNGLGEKVKMLGVINRRDELARHYAAADIFLFPSLYDNAPLVVREAAAMRVPSILAEGSTASEVINDGANGFLIRKDAKNLADAIIRLDNDRAEIRRAGIEASNTLVRSWADIVDEVIERYNDIISRQSR